MYKAALTTEDQQAERDKEKAEQEGLILESPAPPLVCIRTCPAEDTHYSAYVQPISSMTAGAYPLFQVVAFLPLMSGQPQPSSLIPLL
tara:strand:- start:226 stop:489 length:264 start_codon:yes stop_codon:yes gene_type:complete